MVRPRGNDPRSPIFQNGAFTWLAWDTKLVDGDGIEPPMSGMLAGYSRTPYRSGNYP